MFGCFEDSYDRETLIAVHKEEVEHLKGVIRRFDDERVQLKNKLKALAEMLAIAHEECRTINHTTLWKWARGDGDDLLAASLGEPDSFSAPDKPICCGSCPGGCVIQVIT